MIDSRPVDIHLLAEEWEHVLEAEGVIGEWAFQIREYPITLRIKVVKTTNPPDMYIGIANYRIKSPRQNGPHMSMYPKDIVKEALEDALRGFLMWYNPEEVEETALEPVDDW